MATTRTAFGVAGVLGLVALVCVLAGCGPTAPTATVPDATAPTKKVELLVFSAKWCGVCRDVPPVLTKLRAKYPKVTIRELDVDTDEGMKLAAEYNADALPYYFLLVDGKMVDKSRGFLPYPDAERFVRDASR
jgi:thiol-disulfide isomerase/thioredoxin